MIVVKIELHSARTGFVTEIGRMHIANITGNGQGRWEPRADYNVKLFRRRSKGGCLSVLREGTVKDFPRLSYNVWRLVTRALKSVFPEETT